MRAVEPNTDELPTFSVLVETENLASAGQAALRRCLRTLAEQHLSPARANEVLLLDSGDSHPDQLAGLRAEFPWIDVVPIGATSDYYDAKRLGAEHATGDVVVLCDSDCTYDRAWLGELLAPFSGSASVEVVTGETTTPISGPYALAMALTYLFPRFSNESELSAVEGYDTNNVAFRRDLFLTHPIPSGLPMYRGNHVLQARSLRRRGHTILRQPRARATHPLPKGPSSFAWRFLLLGDEAMTIARLDRRARAGDDDELPRHDGGAVRHGLRDAITCFAIAAGRIKRFGQRLRAVYRGEPRRLAGLPLAVPIAAAATLLYWAGLVASYLRPGWLLAVYRRARPD